jgi:hypothetical protein
MEFVYEVDKKENTDPIDGYLGIASETLSIEALDSKAISRESLSEKTTHRESPIFDNSTRTAPELFLRAKSDTAVVPDLPLFRISPSSNFEIYRIDSVNIQSSHSSDFKNLHSSS